MRDRAIKSLAVGRPPMTRAPFREREQRSRRRYRTKNREGVRLEVDELWCPECRQRKPIDAFRILATGSHESYCRDCHNARNRAWRAENRESINARRRAAYAASRESESLPKDEST